MHAYTPNSCTYLHGSASGDRNLNALPQKGTAEQSADCLKVQYAEIAISWLLQF
jgi:hypothetical protein